VVAHTGYRRLPNPVTPVRRFVLNHSKHELTIEDSLEGTRHHRIEIPLHLPADVRASISGEYVTLKSGARHFNVETRSPGWDLAIRSSEISSSYGTRLHSSKLVWTNSSNPTELSVLIRPALSE
jgi:hypothetical protein